MKYLFLMILTLGSAAQAQELFYDSCQVVSQSPSRNPYIHYVSSRMTCEQLKSAEESLEILSMVLMPASLALSSPGVQPLLAAELVSLGLTLANPAVLGVTVLGAVGVSTIYILVRQSLRDCERMEREVLKRALIKELEEKYGIRSGQNPGLKFKR